MNLTWEVRTEPRHVLNERGRVGPRELPEVPLQPLRVELGGCSLDRPGRHRRVERGLGELGNPRGVVGDLLLGWMTNTTLTMAKLPSLTGVSWRAPLIRLSKR